MKPHGMAKQASDIIAPLKADSANKPMTTKSKSCVVTEAEAQAALAEAGVDCNSSNNPEESGLIKVTPIESCSTNGTSDVLNSAAEDFEEEKKSEVGIEEIGTEPRTVAEVFKQRLADLKKQTIRSATFADQLDFRNPQLAAEFAPQIYANMRSEENRLKVSPNYLKEVQLPD